MTTTYWLIILAVLCLTAYNVGYDHGAFDRRNRRSQENPGEE